MSAPLGLCGWLLAAVGLGAAMVLRRQFLRQLEAVARACHEVRGPLAAARLGVELSARSEPLRPRRLRALELELGRATLALQDLSDSYPGRRSEGVRPDRRGSQAEDVDLAELVGDSVEAWRPSSAACGVELEFDCAEPAPVVRGERLRLAQAIGNLLANAIEHGGGTVTVTLRAERGLVRIEVTDDGPGLPKPIEELRRRRRRGLRHAVWVEHGHGLAVASRIAAAHGGRLAGAPSDRGARLVLELPAAAVEPARGSRRAASRTSPA